MVNGGIGAGLCGQTPVYSYAKEAASLKAPSTKRITGAVGVSKVFSFGTSASLSSASRRSTEGSDLSEGATPEV